MQLYKILRIINNLLLIAILAFGSYIIASPYIPLLAQNPVKENQTIYDKIPYESSIARANGLDTQKLKPVPKENRIVIPKMGLDAPILESEDREVLDQGVWRRPNTSNPENGSNTVIVAHRFLYTKANTTDTFYFLDKLTTDDLITVFWNGKDYNYKVKAIKEVTPDMIEVEDPSDKPILTLYTCTPILTAENRLVVIAELIEENELDNI